MFANPSTQAYSGQSSDSSLAVERPDISSPVGSRAAYGALWAVLGAALNKVITFGSQIVLAWFLVPEQFGLAAMALSVMSVTSIFGGATLRAILIQRSDRFEEVAGQVFWMGLGLNLVTALLLVAAAPLGALVFSDPRVAILILVAAVAPPIQSLSIVHAALLNRRLRFGELATVQFCGGLGQNLSAMLLAACGAGALALILPLIVNAIIAGMLYRRGAGRISVGRPRPRSWGELQGPVVWLMANTLGTALQTSGPNFALGLIERDATITGLYYWGFSFASQAIFLLGTNLQYVFFPALRKLNAEPARQALALERAGRTLMIVVVPIILLQALLAPAFIQLVFDKRWLPAVPVVQWISLGLITQPVGLLTMSILLARGEFRRLAWFSGTLALCLTAAAVIGAALGNHVETSFAIGVTLFVGNLAAGTMLFGTVQAGARFLWKTALIPLAFGAPVGCFGWWLVRLTEARGPWVQMAVVTSVTLASYLGLVRLLQPTMIEDILLRLRRQAAPEKPAIPGG